MKQEKPKSPDKAIRRTVDIQPGDYDFIVKYQEEVEMLAGCVIEMLETNPAIVLSPVMRRMVIEKAKVVERMRRVLVAYGLCVDNLHKPLMEQLNAAASD